MWKTTMRWERSWEGEQSPLMGPRGGGDPIHCGVFWGVSSPPVLSPALPKQGLVSIMGCGMTLGFGGSQSGPGILVPTSPVHFLWE